MISTQKAFRGATLAFTGFWLLATSRAPLPARDCFANFQDGELLVTLGATRPPADPRVPGCGPVDGLREGAVVRARLNRSATRPKLRRDPQSACWGYDSRAIDGPAGLSEQRSVEPEDRQAQALFEVESKFTPEPPAASCPAYHRLSMAPAIPVPEGGLLNPLRAGAEPWLVRRFLRADDAASCLPSTAGLAAYCEDTFEVRSVTLAR